MIAAVVAPAGTDAATWTSGAPHGVPGARVVGDPGDVHHVVITPAFGGGVLDVTRDGGATWAQRDLPDLNGFDPHVVVFPGPPAAIVVLDDAGLLARSTDDGRTWTTVSERVVAIDRADPGHVLRRSATDETFEASRDGGATWIPATLPPRTGDGYAFAGGDVIWSFTITGIVYRSPDLGATWQVRTGIPDGDIVPAPGDPLRLWAGLFRSLDAGVTWARSGPPDDCVSGQKFVAGAPLVPWAQGCAGIFRSPDGGVTWAVVPGTRDNSGAPESLGVMAGGATAMVSTGGDGPWLVAPGHEPEYRGGDLPPIVRAPLLADPADPRRAYAAQFSTVDGGATWAPEYGLFVRSLARVGDRLLTDSSFRTQSRRVAGGPATRVPLAPAFVVGDPAGRRAWVVGEDGRMLTTTDGIRFRALPRLRLPSDAFFFEVAHAAGGRGRTLALQAQVGDHEVLVVSRDAGRTTRIRRLRVSFDRVAVDAVDGRLIVAADGNGRLYRSTDGGAHFRVLRSVRGTTLAVDQARRGTWFAAMDGRLAVTRDAGRTWRRLVPPPGGRVVDLSAGAGRLWAATDRLVSWRPLTGGGS